MERIRQFLTDKLTNMFYNTDHDDIDVTNERTERLSWRTITRKVQK